MPHVPSLIGVLVLCAVGAVQDVFPEDRSPWDLREEIVVQASALDQVEVSFVARDRAGQPVAGLRKEDLRLKVDGKPTALESVAGTMSAMDVPLSIAFVIDVSGSMARIERARFLAGARALLARLRPIDEMMLVTFAAEPAVACDFSSDPGVLSRALETIARPDGGTNLDRALEAAEDRLSIRSGRGVVILYSDGAAPVRALLTMPYPLEATEGTARRTVPVYWIVPHFQGIGAVQRNDGLRNLVIASGGRWIFEARGLESALDEVGSDLSARYDAIFVVERASHRRRTYAIELDAIRAGTTILAPQIIERSSR